jgi:hypothetical protein
VVMVVKRWSFKKRDLVESLEDKFVENKFIESKFVENEVKEKQRLWKIEVKESCRKNSKAHIWE